MEVKKINKKEEIIKLDRAEYGKQIVQSLSTQLTTCIHEIPLFINKRGRAEEQK